MLFGESFIFAQNKKMKSILTFSFCLLSFVFKAQEPNYVVMLSLDGFRADYIEKYQPPNIIEIAQKGVRVQKMQPSNPTKTFPNHYTLATGLYPDHHGLIGNAFYAPDLKKEYKLSDRKSVENGDFYGGEPIWNTAQKAGLKTASFFWVGSEAKINNRQPDIWKKYNSRISFEQRVDSVISWLKRPQKIRPQLIMLYYNEPDHSGHNYGPDSPQVAKQVKYVDEKVGELYRKLMALPIASQINFILVSDHGMRSISEDKQIVLSKHLPSKWVKGIYGSNPVYTIRTAEGYRDSVYQKLKKIKHLKVYLKGKAPKFLHLANHSRTGDMMVLAKKGYSLLAQQAAGQRKFGGTHGYLNTDPQMSALFVATGNVFKQNYTKRKIKNVDVYNLVAHILNIQAAPNDGKFRRVKNLLKAR